ncbi:unnamed protein product [Auanema sp. JU1783]|nr:unnamed protein product [Auanema sp. JU1783]
MNKSLIVVLFLIFQYVISHPYLIEKKGSRKVVYEDEQLGFNVKCSSCVAALSFMSFIVKADASVPVILEFAKVVCKIFAKQSWVVCDGISNQFKEEFFYVFRRLSSSSASEVCGILLPDCADPSDKSQSGWEVELPPKPKIRVKSRQSKKGRNGKKLRVLQLSDLHIDYEYLPGSEAYCALPVCCQTMTKNPTKPAGYWGTSGDCDVPLHTLKHMIEHIKATENIDYIMMSGDFLNHVDWKYSKELHMNGIHNISSMLKQVFPETPIYWAIGNHEGVPVNSFAPHFVTEEKFLPTWLYETITNVSNPWLNEEAVKTNNYRGSYSSYPAKGLKLISLNTGYCETTNFFLYLNQSDPDGTMSWLVSELYESEKIGEAVHIMAHIPPGDDECLEGWARNYYRIVQRFSQTIVGQFFGHVHLDYFIMFYENMNDPSSKPVGVAYSSPSVTTFSNMNPAYRVYTIDPSNNFKVDDIDNYWTDVDMADEQNPPVWNKLYSAKDAYGLKDFSPDSWNTVMKNLLVDEELRKQFVRYSYRKEKNNCNFMCQNSLMCQIRSGHHNMSSLCMSEKAHERYNSYQLGDDQSYLQNNRIPK